MEVETFVHLLGVQGVPGGFGSVDQVTLGVLPASPVNTWHCLHWQEDEAPRATC